MSNHPELEMAIDEIVNEAITRDEFGKIVDINLDKLKQPESIKKKIIDEFENIQKMLNFKNLADDLFKRWYIDGRIFYQVVVDETKPKEGILELRYIDPRKIRKVREINKDKDTNTGAMIIKSTAEYYVYSERGTTTQSYTASINQGVRIATDAIINVNSGMMDAKNTFVISYLHKAIKPLNQLRMIEDAIVIYRISRAPERRIFYIDVGNLPKGKAEQYLRDVMVKYRNKMVYDACLGLETKIPLLDGRELKLSEIIEEYNAGKELWAYSCDPTTGKFAPGIISWAGITKKDQKVMKLTLDNGESITCTPDHKYPVWDKGFIEARDLIIGESIIPFYSRKHKISKNGKNYQQIFDNESKKWCFIHRKVSNWKDEYNIENEFLFNDNFRNKIKEGWSLDTRRRFSDYGKEKSTEYFINMNKLANKSRWGSVNSKENRKKHSDRQTISYPSNINSYIDTCAKKQLSVSETITLINSIINFSEWQELNKEKSIRNRPIIDKFTLKDLTKVCNKFGFSGFKDYKDSYKFKNHKIVKIEYLDDVMDVGTLTIDREEKYHNYHTFALSSGIYTKNSTGELRDDRKHMSMLEDFWLPRREGGKGTEITTLPAGQNLGELEDVKYFRNKLLNALNVPISRLEPQEGGMIGVGRSTEVTRDEVKFSKFIQRLRIKFSRVFDEALSVQLALKGICTKEEWSEFKEYIFYDYKKDNNFTELRESEILRERLTTLGMIDPYIGKFYDMKWVRRNVLQLNEEEISEMKKGMEEDEENGETSLSQDQQAMAQQQEEADPDVYKPEDNTVENDDTESHTPMLDAEVKKNQNKLMESMINFIDKE